MKENEEIISYLEKELKMYESILYLIHEQGNAIKTNNIKGFHSLLYEKESYIKNIKNMQRHNSNQRKLIMLKSEGIMPDNGIVVLIRKIKSLITKAVKHNRNNMELLTSVIDAAKTKANNLNRGGKMVSSLRMQQSYTPRFVNVMS